MRAQFAASVAHCTVNVIARAGCGSRSGLHTCSGFAGRLKPSPMSARFASVRELGWCVLCLYSLYVSRLGGTLLCQTVPV